MTFAERDAVLNWRSYNGRPWHSPPHSEYEDNRIYLLSAACYEHKPIIGNSIGRMRQFQYALGEFCKNHVKSCYAWCILPNHYHLLIATQKIRDVLKIAGQLHGRTSRQWNLEDNCTGRKVWFNCAERCIRSERHFWVSVNYVHHNPVKHGYCKQWTDWPFSSATEYLEQIGRDKAVEIWNAYPVLQYGKKWDY